MGIEKNIWPKFSKISYLRKRWEEPTLSIEKLHKYNKWSSDLRYKVIVAELRLEHYLIIILGDKFKLLDLNKIDYHFTNKSKNKVEKIINKINDSIKSKKKIPTNKYMKSTTLGQKIIIWKGLKNNVFKEKYSFVKSKKTIISKKEKNELRNSIENIRILRNGIAHLDSKKQILSKIMPLNNEEKNKETILKNSLRKWVI